MLKKVGGYDREEIKGTAIAQASFPVPFRSGLEYNPPARGTWNIVHTGMLIPQSHQIYVCAQGCLRGVVLTAAEMNAMDRMSWVSLREDDMFNGEMEQRIYDGVVHIVERMDKRPRCIPVYVSCMHLFEGIDFAMIIDELSEKFPDIDFIDCYMIPTMRKSISPDALMKRQLYKPVKKLDTDESLAALIGFDRPTDRSSELFDIFSAAGKRVWEITGCRSYDDYLALGSASLAVYGLPVASAAGADLERRTGIKTLYLPLCYDHDGISRSYDVLCDALGIKCPDLSEKRAGADRSLDTAREIVGDMPIAVDFTAVPRPLGFCLMLAKHGFRVSRVYTDVFSAEEKGSFDELKKLLPELEIYPTLDVRMRFAAHESSGEFLAVGQKAAYFCNTDRFVNIIEGGGMYGFDGIKKMGEALIDAYTHPKETKATISLKGLGCESCL